MQDTYNEYNQSYELYIRREVERKAIRRTALGIGLALIIYFVSSYAVSIMLAFPTSVLLGTATTIEMYDVIYESYTAICYLAPILLALIPVALLTRIPFRIAIPMRRTPLSVSVPSIMLGLGVSTIGIVMTSILFSAFETFGISYNLPASVIPQSMIGKIMYLVAMSVLPAIFEEILFRGYVLQSLRRFGDWFAIIISALVFALFHGNFAQIFNTFLCGMIMAIIAVRTGSLKTGMALHFINNFFVSLLEVMWLSKLEEGSVEQALATLAYIALYIFIGIIGALITAVKNPDLFSFRAPDSPLTRAERSRAFFLQPLVIIGTGLLFGHCFVYFFKL